MVARFQIRKPDTFWTAVGRKSGAWYAYNGEKIGQGRENAKAYLRSHPELLEQLASTIKAKLMGKEEAASEEALA